VLVQMLAGAASVFRVEGCELVGGHTTEAAQMDPLPTLGFSVTGVVPESRPLLKGPLTPDTCLILTKALGTGMLMVADMKGYVKGDWVEKALDSMLRSSAEAARIFERYGCTACTDVTGFGLVGHLVEMFPRVDEAETIAVTDGDEIVVEISLEDLPLLDGVRESCLEGLFSSLHPEV